MSIVQINRAVAANLGSIIAGRPDPMPDPDPRIFGGGDSPGMMFGGDGFSAFFKAIKVPALRVKELQFYDLLEREIPDVTKALDAYATMAVTGNLAGGGSSAFNIRKLLDENKYPEPLKERLKHLERLIARQSYFVTRTTVKYGSYMPQIIPDRMPDGRMGVAHIRHIPPGTIFRNIQPGGKIDINKYWIQVIDGQVQSADKTEQFTGSHTSAGIPQWMLPHFAMWSNIVSATETLLYGTSLLRPFGAIGLKMHAMLDASAVARLSRAAMRYVWKVDITDLIKSGRDDAQAMIIKRLAHWRRLVGRSSNLLNDATNVDSYEKAPVPDADFFIPAADGTSWGLDTLDGDTNLARVQDIELMARFYFGALGVPPEYLGHERSQGGRSNLSQVDIHFARTVRHIQLFVAAGWEHVVYVDMALGGWDPREYPIECVPPPIGARDDLLQAQIRALESTVIANLRAAGMRLDVNPGWVLRTFLRMDEELEGLEQEEIDQLFDMLEVEEGAPPSKAQQASVREALSRVNGDLASMMRENLRLLAAGHDSTAGAIHSHDQPSAAAIAEAVARELESRGIGENRRV